MANILVHTPEENVTLTARAAALLLEKGDGDAALLYLALLRHHGTVPPRALAGELRWDRLRIEAAEASLRALGLIASDAPPPEPADERPVYRQADIVQRLEDSSEFQQLIRAVEQTLGKKLTTPDVGILLGLYDHVGLPSDVIYQLVCHCADRCRCRYGDGRRPTLRQIEKEGYAWARMGIDTQRAAAEYMRRYAERQEAYPRYMRALGLGDRRPVESEERYIRSWMDKGFDADAVALAYDKTVLYKKELNWRYLNGILRRWDEQGWHTAEEVRDGEEKKPAAAKTEPSGLEKYMEW